jgi:hypothetical protein
MLVGTLDWGMDARSAITMGVIMPMPDGIAVEAGSNLEPMIPALAAMGYGRVVALPLRLKANAVERTASDGGAPIRAAKGQPFRPEPVRTGDTACRNGILAPRDWRETMINGRRLWQRMTPTVQLTDFARYPILSRCSSTARGCAATRRCCGPRNRASGNR